MEKVGAERPTHHCGVPLWETMRRYGAEVLAVEGHQGTDGGAAEIMCLIQYRLEHRQRIARRAVDDTEHLGQRRLSRHRRVALGAVFVELSPQRRVGVFEFGHRFVLRRGH